MSTEAVIAAQNAIHELIERHDVWLGDHEGEPFVSLGEGGFAGPRYHYRSMEERGAIKEWLGYEWLVAHGLPTITLAALYGGQPYPRVSRPESLNRPGGIDVD